MILGGFFFFPCGFSFSLLSFLFLFFSFTLYCKLMFLTCRGRKLQFLFLHKYFCLNTSFDREPISPLSLYKQTQDIMCLTRGLGWLSDSLQSVRPKLGSVPPGSSSPAASRHSPNTRCPAEAQRHRNRQMNQTMEQERKVNKKFQSCNFFLEILQL